MVDKQLKEKIVSVAGDAEAVRLRAELSSLKKKYVAALEQLSAEREAVKNLTSLRGIKSRQISRARPRQKRPEATAVLVLSDWHCEEVVRPERCRNLNEYNLQVADRRIKQLVQRASMLIEHERALTEIRRVVVLALGDFISGHIHEDLVEATELPPLAAIRWAGERLGGVIDAMHEIAPVLVATACGNHGRSTQKPRISTEQDHSYEHHLYMTMASAEKRPTVSWQIGEGYLNIVDIDGFVIRAHHGHAIKYGGGIGTIAIPAMKAVSAWNAAGKADLDVFGHWHQFMHIPYRFVSNASLIGHSAFAERIKAEWQPPSQSLIVVDHEHSRVTKVLPIFVQ